MTTAGVLGLGLIGGSLCKAYKRSNAFRVLAYDIDASVLDFARLSGAVDGVLDDSSLSQCDVLLLAAYPAGTMAYLEANAPFIPAGTLVVDCLGTKREVCRLGFALAERYGFTFVGGHPMAGTQYSGFKYARADLFDGAPMVLVPPRFDDMELLDRLKALLAPVGFGRFTLSTAEDHDRNIAFTSQLAHVVSNAYIKSPTAGLHKGFSAGSYRDLTRVAWLNPAMWSELFLENRDNLIAELDCLMGSLGEYRDALARGDGETLTRLLDEGRRRKKEIDGT